MASLVVGCGRRIRRIIVENETSIVEAWHEHCGSHGI